MQLGFFRTEIPSLSNPQKKGVPYVHMRKFRDVSTKLDDVVTLNNLFLMDVLVKQPFSM